MSPLFPWSQQEALPPGAPEKAPPTPKKNWWEEGAERWQETGGFTMPWQTEHWEDQPALTRHLGKAGLGVGLTAGGALAGMAAPGLAFGASRFLPWLAKPALGAAAPAGALGALGKLGGLGGLMGSAFMAPGAAGVPVPPEPYAPPTPGVVPPVAPPTLPPPGPPEAGVPTQPEVIEIGGQTFWWNPSGGMYGTGGWDLIPARTTPTPGLTPEQEIAQAEAQRAHQLEALELQYKLEQQAMGAQAGYSEELQAAAAKQQMEQMYAADPYKYWAQLGTPTPEAVARLTGGAIAPGEEFEQGVPLSTPSAQWWQNLLPSEQQQIAGGLNWMGIDPQDYYSMYQRMIPGLGQRQVGPVWAR